MPEMFTVYESVYAYAKGFNTGLFQGCLTSVLSRPNDKIYTPKGKVTKIRQVDAGGAGTYNKKNGFMGTYGGGRGVEYIGYEAKNDRVKVLRVDALDEQQSFEAGQVPSIQALAQDFMDNHLCSEIDASNIAEWYNKVPVENSHVNTDTGYKTDIDNILTTHLQIRADVFNSGFKGRVFLFERSDVYANFLAALIKNNALAAMCKTERVPFVFPTGFEADEELGIEDKLTVYLEVTKFNNMWIIEMPSDRMFTKIILNDGVSEGQEDGGYIGDITSAGGGLIDILAIPEPAGFTDTRYLVANYLVPGEYYNDAARQLELRDINKRMYGNVEIGYAGVNQKGNDFEYDIRIMYGGDLFDNRRRNCFAITGPLAQ